MRKMRISKVQIIALKFLYNEDGTLWSHAKSGSMSVRTSDSRAFIEGTTIRSLIRKGLGEWSGGMKRFSLTQLGASTAREILGLKTSLEHAGDIVTEVLHEKVH